MAPVVHGLCRFESLKDGTLDLCDVALMNDVLMCKADNELLAQRRAEDRRSTVRRMA